MPVFNFTIDDASPLIKYNGQWIDTPANDSFISKYTHSTFHASNATGSTASFKFNGSAVYVYGAKRPNYGNYSVSLDNATGTTASSEFSNPIFDRLLFKQAQLELTNGHQLVMLNEATTQGPSSVDIDFITVTIGDGVQSTQSADTIWDDFDARIKYTGGWETKPNNFTPSYYMRTMHVTCNHQAAATIPFTGSAIAIYGATSGNHGLYSVSLDGAPATTFDGHASHFRAQELLYHASNLAYGPHVAKVTVVDKNKLCLDLDRIVVSDWRANKSEEVSPTSSTLPADTVSFSITGVMTTVIPQPSTTGLESTAVIASSHRRRLIGIICGVVGGAVILITLALALPFVRRRHTARIVPSNESRQDLLLAPKMGTAHNGSNTYSLGFSVSTQPSTGQASTRSLGAVVAEMLQSPVRDVPVQGAVRDVAAVYEKVNLAYSMNRR